MRTVQMVPVMGLGAQVPLLGVLAASGRLSLTAGAVGLVCAAAVCGALTTAVRRRGAGGLGPADWVTLCRAMLTAGVAGLTADAFRGAEHVPVLVAVSGVALLLDGVDGRVARRTGTSSALGARFDMEVDALLILVLSVYVARSLGAWVLAIGAARYAFVAAGVVLPWLRRPLPARYWRKVVAATQGVVLTVAAAGVLPRPATTAAVVGSLVLLTESFGRDVIWLWLCSRRRSDGDEAPAVVADVGVRRLVRSPRQGWGA